MNARATLIALVGTAFLVFAFPYILAPFGMAPNGTETLLLVVALWAVGLAVSRRRDMRRRLNH